MSKPETTSWRQRIWDLLTRPSHTLQAEDQRRKARTLSALILLMMPLMISNIVVSVTSGHTVYASLLGVALIVPAYGLSRTKLYMVGGVLSIAIGLLIPVTLVMTNPGQATFSFVYITDLTIVAVLIATFTFNLRMVITLMAAAAAIVLTLLPILNNTIGTFLWELLDYTALIITVVAYFFLMRRFDLREREIAMEALRRSEQLYRTVVDSQGELICRWLPDTTLTFVNDTYCRYHEASREDLIGKRVYDILSEPEKSQVKQHIQKNLETIIRNGEASHETQFQARSGETLWLYWVDRPIYGENGAITEFQSVGRDITQRRQAETELRLSEERYRAVVELQGEVICRWLPDTTITFANDAYIRLHETTRDELIGTRILDRIQEPERSFVSERVKRMVDGLTPHPYENRWRSPTGREYWMQWTDRAIYDQYGKIIEFQTVGRDMTERKRAEDALRAQQQRYETLVNTVNGVVWEIDARTLQTYFVAKSVETILGYTVEEITNTQYFWRDHIHPDDQTYVLPYARAKFDNGESYVIEYRMIGKDGRIVWLKDLVAVVEDEYGRRTGRGISIDVTAEKIAQAAEIEQRRLAEALRDTSAVINTSLDLDVVLDRILDQVTVVIPSVAQDIMLIEDGIGRIVRLRGYPPMEVNAVMQTRIPVDKISSFNTMIQTGNPYIISETRSNPGWTDFSVSGWIRSYVGAPIVIDGQTIGFLNVASALPHSFNETHASRLSAFADQVAIAIRNARLFEEVRNYADKLEGLVVERTAELDFERERLQIIFNSTGEGILYTEMGVIRYVNRAMLQLTGYTEQELLGRTISIFAGDRTRARDLDGFAAILRGAYHGDVWRDDLRIARKDGSYFDAGLTVSLVNNPGDAGIIGAVTIVRDISREKALQLQKSNFVAHASHELRTPLTNLKTRLYLMRRTPDRMDQHVTVMEQVTDRMAQLVEDLLDITRFERGIIPLERKLTDLRELITNIIALQVQEAELKRITLTQEYPEEQMMADVDASRISQVIINLVTNAINYTPEGGSVTVSLERDRDTHDVLISVRDTGVGIAPENLPHIFQPFFRVVSEVEGTGLGLSISKEIAESHDGTIDVESRYGEGSTFTLRLPESVLVTAP